MTIALILLGAFSFITLKGSLDLTAPRRWTIYQNMTDAYMSYEQAYAERISFSVMNGTDAANGVNPWDTVATTTQVDLGVLPNGTAVTGMVTRISIPDPNNIPLAGTPAEIDAARDNNPTEIEAWELQSHLTYRIGNDTYYKSRTIIRSQ